MSGNKVGANDRPWRFVLLLILLARNCSAVTISITEEKRCMRVIVNHDYNGNGLIDVDKEYPLVLERIAATEEICNNTTKFTSKLIAKDLARNNTSSRYKAIYDELSCLYCQVQMGQQVDLQLLSSDSTSGTIHSDYCCNPDYAHIRSIRIPDGNSTTTATNSINAMYTELLCSMFIQAAFSSCHAIEAAAAAVNSSTTIQKPVSSKNNTIFSNKTVIDSNSSPKIQSNETFGSGTINNGRNDIKSDESKEWLTYFHNNIIPISILWGLLVGSLCVFYAFCRFRAEYTDGDDDDDDENCTTGTTKDGDNSNEGGSGPVLTRPSYSRPRRIVDMNILSLRPSFSVASACSPRSSNMSVIPEETIIYIKSPCRHLVHVPEDDTEDDMEDSNHELNDIPLEDTNIRDLEQGFANKMPKYQIKTIRHDTNEKCESVADTSAFDREPADEELISTIKGSSHSCSTSSTDLTSSRSSMSVDSSNSSGRMTSLLDKLGLFLCNNQATTYENNEQVHGSTTINQRFQSTLSAKNEASDRSPKEFDEPRYLPHPNNLVSAGSHQKKVVYVNSKHNVPTPEKLVLRQESNNSASDDIDLYSDDDDDNNNISTDDTNSVDLSRTTNIVDMGHSGEGAESDSVVFSTAASKLFPNRYDDGNLVNAGVSDTTMKKMKNHSQSHTNYNSGEEDEAVWNCLTDMQREQAWSEFTEQSKLHQRSDDYYTSDDEDNYNHSPLEQAKKQFQDVNNHHSISVHPTQASLLDTTVIKHQPVVIQSDGNDAIIQRGLGGIIIM